MQIFTWILRALVLVLTLALLAAIGYGVYLIGAGGIWLAGSLDKTVAAAFIAASATIVVSVFTLVSGNVYSSRLRINEEIRAKKVPIYESLLAFIFRFLNSDPTHNPAPTEAEMREFMSKFNLQFMVWGSDRVVAAWVKWRRHAVKLTGDPAAAKEAIFLLEDLIFAIRRDLGHGNRGITEGDILAIFINDVGQVLPRRGGPVAPLSKLQQSDPTNS